MRLLRSRAANCFPGLVRFDFYEVSRLEQGRSLRGPDPLIVGKLIGLLKAGTT